MQRMLGVSLAIAGGVAVLWAAYYVMTGQSDYSVRITDNFSVTALTGGLAGLAVLTLGLIWVRD
jgi:multisubunit Na+/H+ antiporter MnhB subunit